MVITEARLGGDRRQTSDLAKALCGRPCAQPAGPRATEVGRSWEESWGPRSTCRFGSNAWDASKSICLALDLFTLKGKAISAPSLLEEKLFLCVYITWFPSAANRDPAWVEFCAFAALWGERASFVGLVQFFQGFPVLGHLRAEDAKERAGITVDGKRDPSNGLVRPSALNHLYFGPLFPVAWGPWHTPGQTMWSSWRWLL